MSRRQPQPDAPESTLPGGAEGEAQAPPERISPEANLGLPATVSVPPDRLEEGLAAAVPDSLSAPDGAASGLGGELFHSRGAPSSASNPAPATDYPVAGWERYEFLGLLGRGGMGAVYKARDRRILRTVALKFIAVAGERMKRRFMQEARMQARLDHPGICQVFETGEVDGKAYIAMEFIDGQSLQRAKEGLSLDEKVRLVREVALALHAAHQAGIIHRDIKPANIMIARNRDGSLRPVLTDFGLARDINDRGGMTESGAVLGTPWYMSPEQTRGEVRTLDHRTDIYSLGATLYELVAGRPPFHSETTVDAMVDAMLKEPPLLSQVARHLHIPKGLDVIVGKCLNKEPAQRYATAAELAADLDRLLDKQPVQARRLGLIARLRLRARSNKPAAAAGVALVLALLSLVGYGVHTRWQALRREQQAQQRALLAQRLGQAIEQQDALARLAYAMPLHNARDELERVRRRMRDIEHELRSHGELGTALAHYALGRGHVTLHEWQPALVELRRAQALGWADGELDYALGRTLGALYSEGLAAARKSGEASFLQRRQRELSEEFLQPALRHLARCRSLDGVSTSYVEGLIDYYQQHWDAALLHAQMAQRQTPWAYEALKLAGDVHLARGLSHRDHGDYAAAASSLNQALSQYQRASELGRSDYQIYEAMAEIGIRQMELEVLRGRNPREHLALVFSAAERAVEADPVAAAGAAKQAFATLFMVQHLETERNNPEREQWLEQLVAVATRAVARAPRDEYAQDVLGTGYVFRAAYAIERRRDPLPDLRQARAHFAEALAINPRFPWAYNDLGGSFQVEANERLARHQDPTSAAMQAIAALQQAVRLDPEYAIGYSNIALTYSNLARHAAESGSDPSEYVIKAEENAAQAEKIDKGNLLAAGSRAFAYLMQAVFEHDSGSDIEKTIDTFNRAIESILQRSPDLSIPYQHKAMGACILGMHRAQKQHDPEPAFTQALAAVAACQQRTQGIDANCASIAALVWANRAERATAGERAVAVDRARASAGQALQSGANDSDVLLVTVEALLRLARLKPAPAPLPGFSEIEAGLRACQAILQQAPTWPRALIFCGGLQAMQAQRLVPPLPADERQRRLQAAQARLQLGALGNPRLRRAYSTIFAEAGLTDQGADGKGAGR